MSLTLDALALVQRHLRTTLGTTKYRVVASREFRQGNQDAHFPGEMWFGDKDDQS